jgi:hypothetical protein
MLATLAILRDSFLEGDASGVLGASALGRREPTLGAVRFAGGDPEGDLDESLLKVRNALFMVVERGKRLRPKRPKTWLLGKSRGLKSREQTSKLKREQ